MNNNYYNSDSFNGSNVINNQSNYDLVFKDIIVYSNRRNIVQYPNPSNYTLNLNFSLNNIYKAEVINVKIPAATDPSVNITNTNNRLYFKYTYLSDDYYFYIQIQAGTYGTVYSLTDEIQRVINYVLNTNGIPDKSILLTYSIDLNRIIFTDTVNSTPGNIILYPKNGYVINGDYTVTNSLASVLLFDSTVNSISSKSIIFKTINNFSKKLYIQQGVLGDYGSVNGTDVPLSSDEIFNNAIASDLIIPTSSLMLSINELNGSTVNIVGDENNTGKGSPNIFCNIPTGISTSTDVHTFLNKPAVFSAVQFYNPPISSLRKLEIRFYDDDGNTLNLLDHSFTLRVYYLQKRANITSFTTPLLSNVTNNNDSGTKLFKNVQN